MASLLTPVVTISPLTAMTSVYSLVNVEATLIAE